MQRRARAGGDAIEGRQRRGIEGTDGDGQQGVHEAVGDAVEPGVATPRVAPGADHVFHQYTIRVPRRDSVQKALAGQGIATTVYYPTPVHLQPIYSSLGYHEGDLPASERACREVLSLPMYAELSRAQIERVAAAIKCALQ